MVPHFKIQSENDSGSFFTSAKNSFLFANTIKNPDFKAKDEDNPDAQTREISFRRIFEEVIRSFPKTELDLHRMLAKDDAFKQAMQDTLKRMLAA